MARRLRHPHISGYDGFINLFAKESSDIGRNELGQVVPAIIHSEHDTLSLEPEIELHSGVLYRAGELAEAFEGEKLALQGDNDSMCRYQRIESQ